MVGLAPRRSPARPGTPPLAPDSYTSNSQRPQADAPLQPHVKQPALSPASRRSFPLPRDQRSECSVLTRGETQGNRNQGAKRQRGVQENQTVFSLAGET